MALLTDAFKISFPIFVVLIVQATRIDSTTCPALKPVSNFNATAFAGRWYEIKRFKTVVNGLGGTCASFNFTHNSANNISFGLNYYFFNQLITTRDRVMAITNGTFSWNFTIPIVQTKLAFQYSIVDTDYSNYAVTFSCGNIPIVNTNVQLAWIYGRNRTLAQVYVDKAIAALKERGQNTNNFVDTVQTGCTK